jgi:glycosyltransferase involved in cell wall biosynthesis
MAYELPVLATDVGGVSELVHDGETGLLVRTRDVHELAQGLHRLLALDPARRRAMTDRAAAVIRRRHDVGGYSGAFTRLLRGLAKNPDAEPATLLREE